MDTNNTPPPAEHKPAAILLQWTALTHPDHERSKRWYIGGSIFAGACIVFGLFSGAWSFSLVMALVIGAYALLHKTPPARAEMVIAEDGITFGGIFTPWVSLLDFWFIALPQWNELHVMKKTGGLREWSIHTGDIGVPQIRSVLSQYLPERPDQKERLLDRIVRISKL